MTDAAVELELDDIQGLIARGYSHLPSACYVLLRIEDADAAKTWLASIVPDVPAASRKPKDVGIHLAWTSAGLRALGLDDDALATFSREFREGMDAPHRSRILGDSGLSTPDDWRWGGPSNDAVHVLLMLYAKNDDALEAHHQRLRDGYAASGFSEIARLDTFTIPNRKEHFGFNDGIAQPIIQGLSRTGPPENTLAPGEFILGYPNAYDKLPNSPHVPQGADPEGHLPTSVAEDGRVVGDLGKNGSYLVFRQLSQDVRGFWRFVDDVTRRVNGTSDPETRTRMAAKMVGRWPSGAPLTLCPDQDDPDFGTRDDFGYRATDQHGHGCPLGSHIRRTNPRDALEGSASESVKVSNRHRILRRGRSYGAPIAEVIDEIIASEEEHDECGLHFICFNTDIGRQFEFIQHTWINNGKFAGLYTDADPLLGNHGDQGTFTVQTHPVRTRVTGMKRFVEVRGGAYFFLPGLRALRFLASR